MLVRTKQVGCIIVIAGLLASAFFARPNLWPFLRSSTLNVKLVGGLERDQLKSLRCSGKMKVINAALRVPCSPFGEADMGPRVLITGGAGFVGSSLIKALRGVGVRSIKVIDNLWRGRLSNLCDGDCVCDVDLAADFCLADLTDVAQARALFSNVDVVYHLADVVAGIGFVFSNEPWVFDQNIRINANVLHLATQSTTIRDYIYVGTACSFPLELQSSYRFIKLYENQTYPAHPESAYGWSKLMGEYHAELLLKASKASAYSKRDLNIGILRFHNLYGPRSQYESENMAQALPSLIRKAIRFPQEKYMIWGSGKQYRDFMFLDDAVSALLAMRERGMNKGVIQVGTGVPTTISEAARIIQNLTLQCLGKKLSLEFNQSRPEGDMGRVAALDRATALLDWRPRVSIREGLAKTYAWVLRDMLQHAKLEPWMLSNRTVHESTACLEREALRSHGTLCAACFNVSNAKMSADSPGLGTTSLSKQLRGISCSHSYNLNKSDVNRTLVIVLSSTRGHHLTWPSFSRYLLRPLQADLALSVSRAGMPDWDGNGFRRAARYIWMVDDPPGNDYRHYYDEIARACFNRAFPPEAASYIGKSLPNQWLGLIKDTGHPAGSGQLQFFRWLALERLEREGLLKRYSTIVISRSDYLYMRPHPAVAALRQGTIMVPRGEDYGGITDRHTVLSSCDAPRILRLAEMLVWADPETVVRNYTRMVMNNLKRRRGGWNLETVLEAWYRSLGLKIVRFRPVAFIAVDGDDTMPQRWGNSRVDASKEPLVAIPIHPKYREEYAAAAR